VIERPASPCKRKGSSQYESWSAVKDRIDDWWIQSPPQDSGKRALVERYEGTLKPGEAPREALAVHDEEGVVFLDNADDIIEESTSYTSFFHRDEIPHIAASVDLPRTRDFLFSIL